MVTTFESIPYHGNRTDATLDLAQRVVDMWGVNGLMIQMARDVTRTYNARTRLDEADAIQKWVHRRVRYVPDPIGAEMISDPVTVLKQGGDCDDQAILAASLLQAVGHDARVAAVQWKGRDFPSHAVVVDLTAGCVVDPVSVPPDEWPPAGYEVQFLKYINKDGQMESMNGLFSKLIKAVAKPFQKIFPAKTVLGKVLDPLGLTDPSRNLNLAGRVADVVGTAATLAAGGYVLGTMTGATGGFWSVAGAGGKYAAVKAGEGLLAIGKGVGTVAKFAAPALLSMGAGGGQAPQAVNLPGYDASAGYAGTPADTSSQIGYSGGGGGGGSFVMPDGTPGATVPVEDTLPKSPGIPGWMIGTGLLLVGGAIYFSQRNRRTHVPRR